MRPAPPNRSTSTSATGLTAGVRAGLVVAGRVKAFFLVFSIVALCAAALFLAPLIRGILAEQQVEPTGVTAAYLGMPWIALVLALPALGACVVLLRGPRRPFLWMTLATLLLLPALGFFLWGALGAIAAIYEKALSI